VKEQTKRDKKVGNAFAESKHARWEQFKWDKVQLKKASNVRSRNGTRTVRGKSTTVGKIEAAKKDTSPKELLLAGDQSRGE